MRSLEATSQFDYQFDRNSIATFRSGVLSGRGNYSLGKDFIQVGSSLFYSSRWLVKLRRGGLEGSGETVTPTGSEEKAVPTGAEKKTVPTGPG
jgi:hypothetical protein